MSHEMITIIVHIRDTLENQILPTAVLQAVEQQYSIISIESIG